MADPVYRAPPPDALTIEPLGELIAIFDCRSMQTHLVVPPMPEILEAMGAEACDAAALAARLATRFDLGPVEEAKALLAERLAELAAMGLVAEA